MTLPPQNDSPVQWQNFIDVQNDVKRWLQIPPGDISRDQDLQDAVDMACWWIQDYLGRPVAPTTFFRRFSGYSGINGSNIDLPYYPVLSVTSVVEYWGSSGPHTLTEQTPANQGSNDVYTLEPLQGRLIRSFTGLIQRPWFPGLRNIEVTWTAGYQPVPPPFRMAAREHVKWWWANTQEASRNVRLPSGYDMEPQHDTLWPAVEARIKQLLQPYVQVGIS